METLVTAAHFIVALLMIGLILIQQGKGASMGASFGGGSSNTVFGSSGGGSFFGKLTAGLAFVFFVTSLGLTLIARDRAQLDRVDSLPVAETVETIGLDVPSDSVSLPVDQYEVEEFIDTLDESVLTEEVGSGLETDGVESAAPVE